MKRKITWVGLSFLIVAALVLASCGPTAPAEEAEVAEVVPILSIGESYLNEEIEIEVTVLEARVTDSYEYKERGSDSMQSKAASPGTSFLIATIKIDNVGGTDWRPTNPWIDRFQATDSDNNAYLYQEYLGKNPFKVTYILDGTAKDGTVLFNVPEGTSGLKIAYRSWAEPVRTLAEWKIE